MEQCSLSRSTLSWTLAGHLARVEEVAGYPASQSGVTATSSYLTDWQQPKPATELH